MCRAQLICRLNVPGKRGGAAKVVGRVSCSHATKMSHSVRSSARAARGPGLCRSGAWLCDVCGLEGVVDDWHQDRGPSGPA
jgi:hypothetical protein